MIKAGIIGGATPIAGETIRLLLNHPDVHLRWVHSPDNVGRAVADVHGGLTGDTDLRFTDALDFSNIDILFMCVNKGEGRKFIERNSLPQDLRIVDFSGDFRLENSFNDFVYSLPELRRKELVRGATRACIPGALATAVELALLPLARNLMLTRNIHVAAALPASGDDCGAVSREASLPHFSMPLSHPQVEEIRATLRNVQSSFGSDIEIVPIKGNHSRGLAVMVYFDSPIPADTVIPLFREYYDDHNFTFIVDRRPKMEEIINTNKCLIHIENIGGKLVITSIIDNLLKGGAGQAIHAMNLLFGLHEKVGLQLKSSEI